MTVSYKGFTAVADVSFTVEQGKTLVLLGPSGCGKSSLLNAIAGFVPVTSGRIQLGGREITSVPPQQRHMSMVFQTHALFPHLSVIDNVMFGLKVWHGPKRSKAERRERAMDALRIVHLEDKAERYPDSLSGGERQRVAIARALVVNPEVLLLDEPLSSLDARLREELRFELARISAEQHLTMIYVTHDQEEAFSLGDEIAVMRAGSIQQRSSASQIYNEPRTAFVARFIGGSNLLKCTVPSARDDVAQVSGRPVRCRNPWSVPQGEAYLALRGHALTLHAPVADGNGLPATVTDVRYMGAYSAVGLVLGDGQSLRASVAGTRDLPLRAGDDVFVEWIPEDATLLVEERS